ncbi:ABC transporter substrate-binding protein [Chamaesiphon sp.]|uniref:bifunctional serine/threonine-protein kinase/ABC transporter substrate-binding protein n=1 Tax=Chamaesiphon sp. TaxID=2814140 RepID=UPI003593ECD7
MDIYCTRPGCKQPLNSFADLNDRTPFLKTIPQRHCADCGMQLVLDGRYSAQKLLHQSELSVTFLGIDLQTTQLKRCTIEQISIDPSFNPTQLDLATDIFYREAGILEKIGKHPKIPRLLTSIELAIPACHSYPPQTFFYLIQEYIEGQSLQDELLAQGKFTETEVVSGLQEVLRILEFVHFQDVIHRDLKPSNIIRDSQGKIYLTNFGALRQLIAETTRATGSTSTQASAAGNQGQTIYPSSDLYTLAVTCLSLLTDKHPQDLLNIETNHWQWQTPDLQVSDALAAILNTMLQQIPTDRFQSARDVLDVLDDTWVISASITNSTIPTANISASSTLHSSNLSHESEEVGNNALDLDSLLKLQTPLHHNSFLPLDDAPLQLYKTPVEEDTYIQTKHKPWVLVGVLATGIIGLIALVIPRFLSRSTPIATTGGSIVSLSSIGERILLSNEGSRDNDKFKNLKRAGVLAIANQSYAEAVTSLQAALAENPNSPETRIYLNNALIGDRKSYTIATAAPISRSLDRASEMLRGFAQAQAEMNQVGDVNEAKIKLRIVDDSDDPKTIENIATGVIDRSEVLGIVGHNRNDVTMKAANIYNRNKLAFIAPISTANELTSTDKPYIFRTNLKGDTIARKLVDRLVNFERKRKVAIFHVPSISYNDELKTQFADKLASRGGKVVGTFKFSNVATSASSTAAAPSPFDADTYLRQAKARGAEAILLLPVGRSSREALKVLRIRATKYPKLSVVSDTALYNTNTLKAGRGSRDLVIGVPWQESDSSPQFSTGAKQLWNTQVNWATATSYNAVKALGAAIKAQDSPSRASVMKTLSKNEFMGASGRFQFTNGEPTERYILVKVAKTPPNYKYSSGTGYDFISLD